VDHALKRKKALGDTLARLEVLASHDLSEDKDLVARLVEMLKADLPVVVLGFVIKNEHKMLAPLIRALSSTAAPSVREVMEDIVRRFPTGSFAAGASKVLSGFGAGSKPVEARTETLAGEVGALSDFRTCFKLLAESRLTGTLTLSDAAGEQIGIVSLEGGRSTTVRTAHSGARQLFTSSSRRPSWNLRISASARAFEPSDDRLSHSSEMLPMVVEGVRRHDEFREAKILVTGWRSTHGDVHDTDTSGDRRGSRIRRGWSGRKPVRRCGTARSRGCARSRFLSGSHLLAHWVERDRSIPG